MWCHPGKLLRWWTISSITSRENSYYLLYAVLGEFESDLDHRQAAMKHFRKALELATMKSEQIFPTRKIQGLNDTDTNEAQAPGRRGQAI
ncbi:MAG TPA: hypothetical protein VLJ79_19030 [Candidatus Binatia bacterium]|nr:hypothetical protein [Candidatus Binatia bacterium]